MTIGQVYTHLLTELKSIYPYEEAREMVLSLFENHLQISRAKAMLQFKIEVPDSTLPPLARALEDLLKHKPLQYVLGKVSFLGREFTVNQNVLIPRPETEEMVQSIIKELRTIVVDSNFPLRILDIGTGSGVIAISLKSQFPDMHVFAVDFSEDALSVARINAQNHLTEIVFCHADILKPETMEELPQFDILISNPPYVLGNEKNSMKNNVLDYEPAMALFVPDNRPLLFYEAIATYAASAIRPNGYIFLEINESYGEQVKSLYLKHGFIEVEIMRDLFGKDRFLFCRSNQN